MDIWIAIMVFILGLCCGSFINMLVYRTAERYELKNRKFKAMPAGRQVKSQNRSFCDYCGRQLSWYENVPVVSWIMQKGRTKCCHKKLPVLYPIVEITTGLLFLVFLIINYELLITNYFEFIVGLIIITFLVFSTVFDLKYMILPDFSTIILIGCGLLVLIGSSGLLLNHILSAVAVAGFFGLLHLITKGKGMGLGDVKLSIFIGLFLGSQKTILALYVAFILGALFSLILMILKKAGRKSLVPFGPFLILGVFLSWFWGDTIIKFLVSNFF